MALVERPDPRTKIVIAAIIDAMIIGLGAALFVVSGNMVWILGAVFVGAGISVPLIISAMREFREQNNASG